MLLRYTTNFRNISEFNSENPIDSFLESIASEAMMCMIDEIRWEQDEARKKKLKSQLPAVVVGDYAGYIRNASNLIQTDGAIIDIDHVSNPDKIKLALRSIPFIHFAFISPSGDGVKAGIRFNEKIYSAADYSYNYKRIKSFFDSVFFPLWSPGIKLDNTSDCSRLCFFSWDENYYFNSNSDKFIVSYPEKVKRRLSL